MKKKPRRRVRQTLTSFQEAFKDHSHLVQPVPWPPITPELMHLSLALLKNNFEEVAQEYKRLITWAREKANHKSVDVLSLSTLLDLESNDGLFMEELKKGCLMGPFVLLRTFYASAIEHSIEVEESDPSLQHSMLIYLTRAYASILQGRSKTTLQVKFIVLKNVPGGMPHWLRNVKFEKDGSITDPLVMSSIMALFPPLALYSKSIKPELCYWIWRYNYANVPFMHAPDSEQEETEQFKKMKIRDLSDEFASLYQKFKQVDLLSIYDRQVAEVNMGLVARVADLAMDIVELTERHRAELVELAFRSLLDSFILACWLLKQKDLAPYERFVEFSVGKDRFISETLTEIVQSRSNPPQELLDKIKKVEDDAISNSGALEIEVASERGDAFNQNVAQMAEEVWGKNNIVYMFYKRFSEATHGHWRVIKKYHLAQSLNPMHNGLLHYSPVTIQYNGLHAAFLSLTYASELMLRVLQTERDDKERPSHEAVAELIPALEAFYNKLIDLGNQYNKEHAL